MTHSETKSTDPWRVGVLFSRSGATDATETEHFLGTALAVAEINRAGGILGREIEVVTDDPRSDPQTYRRIADRFLTDEGLSVIFGGSSSAQRKAILSSIERRNGLLWYPSLYEGFEYSPNVIYTGATPNQNSFPLAEHLVTNHGKRIFLVGSDYVYPRESNRIMRDLVESHGGEIVDELYLPLTATGAPLAAVLDRIRATRPDAIFSTVVGRTAREFYRLYADAGFDPRERPIASLTMAEGEIAMIGAERCVGHLTAAAYFGSLDRPESHRFAAAFRAAFGADRPVSMWSAGAYAQVHLFAAALARAGTLDTQRLVEAALGLSFEAPEGPIRIDPETNHTWLTPRIGRVRADGGFDVVWEADAPVRPDPYLAVTPLGGHHRGMTEARVS